MNLKSVDNLWLNVLQPRAKASINANLFTMLSQPLHPCVNHSQCHSRYGRLELIFQGEKLARMRFAEPASAGQASGDLSRGTAPALLDWLSNFTERPAESRWQALAPQGTDFQRSVWRQLLEIPWGQTAHYGQIATALGQPAAARAVGSAIAANPICLLIPCHRVVPLAGGCGQYRWGSERKRQLLIAEAEPGATELTFFR